MSFNHIFSVVFLLQVTLISNAFSADTFLLNQEDLKAADVYYRKPYPDDPKQVLVGKVDGKSVRVERPNHSLLHGSRKASLVEPVIKAIQSSQSGLKIWLDAHNNPRDRTYYNPRFSQQLAFAMLLMRTGRTSERNDKYKEDCAQGAKNFADTAKSSVYFKNDQKAIDDFKFALETIGDNSKCFDLKNNVNYYTDKRGCSVERVNLFSIIYGIHHLDLRRMVGFNKDQILTTIASYFDFVDDKGELNPNDERITKLWALSGALLKVTGDRDMEAPVRRSYSTDFLRLSNDIPLLIKKLNETLADYGKNQITPAPTAVLEKSEAILVEEAKASSNDRWFPYVFRPTIDEASNQRLYDEETLNKAKTQRYQKNITVPWSFRAKKGFEKELFSLGEMVPDRTIDKANNKQYILMYHGTTSEFADLFKDGEKAIRFDRAETTTLGMGFYLTSDINEAKHYACLRLRTLYAANPKMDNQGLILVFGIEDNPVIKGKFSYGVHLSDDKTGEPLYENIYFKRNGNLYNQVAFFTNVRPYLKLLKVIKLPRNFGMANAKNDFDGLPSTSSIPLENKTYQCPL